MLCFLKCSTHESNCPLFSVRWMCIGSITNIFQAYLMFAFKKGSLIKRIVHGFSLAVVIHSFLCVKSLIFAVVFFLSMIMNYCSVLAE